MWPFTKKQPNWHQIEIGMNVLVGLEVVRPTKHPLKTRMAHFGFTLTSGTHAVSIPKEVILTDIENTSNGYIELRKRIRGALRDLNIPITS